MRSSVLRPAHCSRPDLLDLPFLPFFIRLSFAVEFPAHPSCAGASKPSPNALHSGDEFGITLLVARSLLLASVCLMRRDSRKGGRDRFVDCSHAVHQRVAPLREERKVPLRQGANCLLERGGSLVLLQA